ncbi:MAG: APC family permease [Thermoplasmatota archaeon]
MAPEPEGLRREISWFGAVSMIVGIVIGSGIFLGVNRVAAGAGSPLLMAAVWVAGGLLTLMGALTYAELGTLFPRAGGEYVFLREGMGSCAAFLSGWTAFTVNLAGSAAALAVVFAEQLDALKPAGFARLVPSHPDLSVKLTASCLILLLAVVNYFGIRLGGNIQKVLTVGKYGLIILLAGAALLYSGASATPGAPLLGFPSYNYTANPGEANPVVLHYSGPTLAGLLSLSLVAALFAYDGWTNVVRVGSELRDPSRNLPRAMLLGIGSVALLYILVSFGYQHVLGWQGFVDGSLSGHGFGARTVASNTASVLFGPVGKGLVAALILLSVFGSLNGITIAGPRIYYAMAKDRLFPRTFAAVNRHHVPGRALAAQAVLSIAFLFAFDFYKLTDNVVFISYFFYGLAAAGLFVLRRTHPEMPRPYRVWGYPVVPLVFVVASAAFVGYLFYDQIATLDWGHLTWGSLNRLSALVVVLAGVPVYALYRRRLVKEALKNGWPAPEPVFGPAQKPPRSA